MSSKMQKPKEEQRPYRGQPPLSALKSTFNVLAGSYSKQSSSQTCSTENGGKQTKACGGKSVAAASNAELEKCVAGGNDLCKHRRMFRKVLDYAEEHQAWLEEQLRKLTILSENEDDESDEENSDGEESDGSDDEEDSSEDDEDGSEEKVSSDDEEVSSYSLRKSEEPFGNKSRYPKRNLPQKNYVEDPVSDDDDYLLCDDCNVSYKGSCPDHGPMYLIKDKKVRADGSVPDRAIKTMPSVVTLSTSSVKRAGLGVWTECALPKGRVFGPYEGKLVYDGKEASKKGYSWQIRKKGKTHHYVDASDLSTSNWLRFVNCAVSEERQNLMAFQYKGNIYYRTYKDVLVDCELMVWYGDSYAKDLGIDMAQVKIPATPKPIISGYRCGICQRLFSSEQYLRGHERQHGNRTLVLKHSCSYCSYSTNDSSHLRRHLLTHAGEKPFKCPECNKGFSRKSHLQGHIRIHTGEKPYKCKFCGKSFSVICNLKRHQLHHFNDKPHICDVCGEGFVQLGNLITHERTHTGQKPYQCPHCHNRCTASSDLKDHIKRRHKDVLQAPT